MSILRKISLVILSNIILISPAFTSNASIETWNPIQTWIQSLSQGTLISIKPIQSYDVGNLRASSITAIDLNHENVSKFLLHNIFKSQGSLEAHIASDDGSRVSINIPEDGACIIDWSIHGGKNFFTIVNGVILQSNDHNINLLLWDLQANITTPSVQSIYNNINGQSLATFINSMTNPAFIGAGNDLRFVMFEPLLTVPACRTWGLYYTVDENDRNCVMSIFKMVRNTLDPQNEKGLLGDQSTERMKGATAIQDGDAKVELSICHEKDEINKIDYYHLDIMSSYVQKTATGTLNRKGFYHKISFLSNIFTTTNQNILYKFKLGKAAHMNRIRHLLEPWVAIDDATLSNIVDQAWAGKQIYLPQASGYISPKDTPWCSLPAAICSNTDGNS